MMVAEFEWCRVRAAARNSSSPLDHFLLLGWTETLPTRVVSILLAANNEGDIILNLERLTQHRLQLFFIPAFGA